MADKSASALMAGPAVSRSVQIETTFAGKLAAYRKAQAVHKAASEEVAQRIETLGRPPVIPSELFSRFFHPEKPGSAQPGHGGWTAEDLTAIVQGRYWDRKAGWMYFLPQDSPVRQKAAELLAARQAYDLEDDQWCNACEAIHASSKPLSDEEDRLALDLMRHPASSLVEISEKIIIAQDLYLFDHADGEHVRDLILKDVLAITDTHHDRLVGRQTGRDRAPRSGRPT